MVQNIHILYVIVVAEIPSGKVNYAKRMAQGYLRSVGMGDYAPKTNNKVREPESSSNTTKSPTDNFTNSRWKRMEDQDSEFDFDI